jgi:hypothetical protein
MKREDQVPTRIGPQWWDQLPLAVTAFRAHAVGNRLGFLTVEIPGLRVLIDGWSVHYDPGSGVAWAAPPPGLRFTDPATADRVCDRVLLALAWHPDAPMPVHAVVRTSAEPPF